MANKPTPYEPATMLPAQRAFVVHFRWPVSRRRRFAGRVEHLASGMAVPFASLRGLLAFIAERLETSRQS
jgi:hypothetical protein